MTKLAKPAKTYPRIERRERSIEATCCAYAQDKGCLVMKLRPPPSGIPDRLMLLPNGVVLFVEFKRQGEGLKPKQIEFRGELVKRRGQFLVCNDVDFFKQALDLRLVGK